MKVLREPVGDLGIAEQILVNYAENNRREVVIAR